MKKILKPASLLFNVLTLLVFFLLGLFYAGLTGAGKNQGLAGGAIVLGWGVLFGGIAFITSFFITYKVEHKKIVIGNWVLFILLLIGYGITHYRFLQKQKLRETKEPPAKERPVSPTHTTDQTAMLTISEIEAIKTFKTPGIQENTMGMGYFSPNYYETNVLYFYGDLNLEKALMEHMPYDSITFNRNKYNSFEIATAPPWLVPHHLKLDYGMLYFRIESVTEEFVEVVVNTTNDQTSYVSKQAGKVVYWPEFLLRVHSVEFPHDSNRKVRARPFEASGIINTPYEFMRPLKIKGDWAEVLLLDGGFKKVGKGWIRWQEGGKLLVLYNLLS
tara:strand:- start:91835 stop:92827 length:993 start_codon:yes stop_codon:yes gene_type:complete